MPEGPYHVLHRGSSAFRALSIVGVHIRRAGISEVRTQNNEQRHFGAVVDACFGAQFRDVDRAPFGECMMLPATALHRIHVLRVYMRCWALALVALLFLKQPVPAKGDDEAPAGILQGCALSTSGLERELV